MPPVSTTPVANLPPVSTTPAANFATSFTSVVDTGGKFVTGVKNTGGKIAAGVKDTGGKLPPVSMTPVANNGINIRLQIPYIYLLTFTIQKDVPTKLLKFPIKDFFPLPPVSTTTVVNLEL